MPKPSEHGSPNRPFDAGEDELIAESMRVFSATSRVRILYALLDGPLHVHELAERADLEASAASHQLRILRQLRFVEAAREGRQVRYALHDHHVADLLAAVRHHREHVSPHPSVDVATEPHRRPIA